MMLRSNRHIAADAFFTTVLVAGTFLFMFSQPPLKLEEMQVRQNAKMALQEASSTPVPVGTPAPTVRLQLLRDPVDGWNLTLQTKNFAFAFDSSKDPGSASGYAALYVDGNYRGRLYSDWANLPALVPGEHILSVMLLDPQFKVYQENGVSVAYTLKVKIGEGGEVEVL